MIGSVSEFPSTIFKFLNDIKWVAVDCNAISVVVVLFNKDDGRTFQYNCTTAELRQAIAGIKEHTKLFLPKA